MSAFLSLSGANLGNGQSCCSSRRRQPPVVHESGGAVEGPAVLNLNDFQGCGEVSNADQIFKRARGQELETRSSLRHTSPLSSMSFLAG